MKLKTVPREYGQSLLPKKCYTLIYSDHPFRSYFLSHYLEHILINRVKGWLERGIKVETKLIAQLLRKEINEQYYINYTYHNFTPYQKITKRWFYNEHVDYRSRYFVDNDYKNSYRRPSYKYLIKESLKLRHMIHQPNCPKKSKFHFNQLCRDLNLKIDSYISSSLKCAGNCGRIIQCDCMCTKYWTLCGDCGSAICYNCIYWILESCDSDFEDYECSICFLKRHLRLFECPNKDYIYTDLQIVCISEMKFLNRLDYKTRNKVINAKLEEIFSRTPNVCCRSDNIPHMVEIFPEKLTEQELEIRKNRGIIYG